MQIKDYVAVYGFNRAFNLDYKSVHTDFFNHNVQMDSNCIVFNSLEFPLCTLEVFNCAKIHH